MTHTQHSLEADLLRLGVTTGSVLFVHASYKSLGEVDGGAATIIAALETVLGQDGTLLMPNFNMASRNRTERAATWDLGATRSSVGYLTEFFRNIPGTVRSDHYSHSVAARGEQAAWLTGGHHLQEGWVSPWDRAPWGLTYGTHSPMLRVDYECLTYSHVAEVSDYNRRLESNPDAPYCFVNRHLVGEWWEECGDIRLDLVGDASCQLFDANKFVDALTAELIERPADFFPTPP